MIYFIKSGEDFVKIGRAKDPEQRLKDLQTGSSEKLMLLKVWDVPDKVETELHFRFRKLRHRGEFFWLHGEIQDFIDSL